MKAKVLVVDDNPDVLYVVKDCLESIDPEITVSCASSGEECLEKVESDRPDIIFMDLMMPKLSGEETVFLLKKDERFSSIPVVYLTGRTDEESRKKCLVNSVGFIEKPFDASVLVEKIREVLGL